MSSPLSSTARGSRPSGRTGAGLWGFFVVAAVVVILLAPSTLGTIAPNVTQRPPFRTATVVLANPQTHSGCGTAKLIKSSAFNKTTGVGGFSDNANTTNRCTTVRNNSALSTGQITITLPIHIATTGKHNISVVWTTIATGSVNLTAGSCRGTSTVAHSSCTRIASAFVFGFAFLMDKTAHTNLSNTNVWPGNSTTVSNVTTCSFLVCTSVATPTHSSALHTGKAFWTWDWTSVSLTATHSYALFMVLFGGSMVQLQTTVGAHLSTTALANAQLNSATLGMQEDLVSITVT